MTFDRWRNALRRTRLGPLRQLAGLFGATHLEEGFWDDLEAALIQADVGVGPTMDLIDSLRRAAEDEGWESGEDVRQGLRRELSERIRVDRRETANGSPHMILVVGVNGSGKTTTVARLARRWQARGADVVLAAGDTFRAAAAEQLAEWAERLDVPLIRGEPGSDPGAVIYNASETALRRGADVLIADTSGRMHTSHNLMAELKKVHRVAGKVIDGSPHEVLLVLDATTGQNGISQARSFVEAVPVSGVVLAKLDSSAKGGVVVSISQELGLPLRYVGLGETVDDLAPFDEDAFLDGLLAEFDGAPAAGDAA